MLSDENDHFVRDYQVAATLTLLEFHNFIVESLEWEPCISSFFTADAMWERKEEFTTLDMGFEPDPSSESEQTAPRTMESVTLCDVLHYMHDRLIYNFDLFGARALYLELIEAEEVTDPTKYPRESFAHGTAPDQYDPDAANNDGSIFDEMMDDFDIFDGEEQFDAYDDAY